MNNLKNVLVLCTGNSCRSQMMHGYLNKFLKNIANVYSAGIETHGLNTKAVAVMKDDGIDISNHTSNYVDEYKNISFDYIITVCDHANQNCPYIAGSGIRLHHNFTDPSKLIGTEEDIKLAFTKTRNLIKDYALLFSKKYF